MKARDRETGRVQLDLSEEPTESPLGCHPGQGRVRVALRVIVLLAGREVVASAVVVVVEQGH